MAAKKAPEAEIVIEEIDIPDPKPGAVARIDPPAVPAGPSPMELVAEALRQNRDLATLEKLLDLQERFERNQARKAYDEAMAAAQAVIPPIKANRKVGYTSKRKPDAAKTSYSHEDLAAIAKIVNPILAAHGLSYRYTTDVAPNQPVRVTCIISHRLGHREEITLEGPRDDSGSKNSIQQVGSTVTYLQRYTLKAALGLSVEHDDDGEAAGGDPSITEEQVDAISNALINAKGDVGRFCKLFKVESLADLRQSRFEEAMQSIEAKRLKMEKAAAAKGDAP